MGVSSKDLVCLLKVVAPRAAYSSYLVHQGCSPMEPRKLAPLKALAGQP